MDYPSELRKLGYTVDLACEGFEGKDSNGDDITLPDIYRVNGFGISMLVQGEDSDTWKQLLDKEAHEARESQVNESLKT